MRVVTQLCDWCGKEAELDRNRNYPDAPRGWFYVGIAGEAGYPEQPGQERKEPLNIPGWQLESLPTGVQVCCEECAKAYLREAARYVAEVMPRPLEDDAGGVTGNWTAAPVQPPPNRIRG